jgi:hypothetical protein
MQNIGVYFFIVAMVINGNTTKFDLFLDKKMCQTCTLIALTL